MSSALAVFNYIDTIANDLKTLMKQKVSLSVNLSEVQVFMTNRQLRELEIEITRYQLLEQEVTDPLAAGLLRIILEELECDLQRIRQGSSSHAERVLF